MTYDREHLSEREQDLTKTAKYKKIAFPPSFTGGGGRSKKMKCEEAMFCDTTSS